MLGIDDPLIWLAYVGCVLVAIIVLVAELLLVGLLVALLSVGYGLVRRNRAPDKLTREDRAWARVEKKVEDEI